MNAQQVYDTNVRQLPPADRLWIARLILDDLTQKKWDPTESAWSEADEHEVTQFSLNHAEGAYPEKEDLV